MVWRVRWAEGRAIVSYPTEVLARQAAAILHGTVTYGPRVGKLRTELPAVRR